jgi:mycothiol synthase
MPLLTSRPCDYPRGIDPQRGLDPRRDLDSLMDLWLAYRAAMDVRLYPTIWRIRLLLTSRVWEPQKDTQIWENEAGEISGFAMLWRRYPDSPYLVLEGFIRPGCDTQALISAMLQWGDRRAREITIPKQTSLTVYASGFSKYNQSVRLLSSMGYTPVPVDPVESNLYLGRSLQGILPPSPLPADYALRKLQDANELEAYQAISGFAKVNPLHLKELLESAEYAFFVILDPEGNFAAYCECSICQAEWMRTGQRLGWIDYVETVPGQQNRGLGRAVLLAGCSQLKDWGAQTALLATTSTNAPALSLYRKTGFEQLEVRDYPVYQKTIP